MFEDIWQYMPHGMCLLWKPWLVILWAGSDILIFLSYFAIPFALLRVLKKRNDVPHRGLVVLFASFILLCGITHVLSIVTLWVPIYPIAGLVKLATGIASMTTAIVLFRLVPTLVALPSPTAMELANKQLREEAIAHEATMASLREVRDRLEEKVAERTAELEESRARAETLAREAVHRSSNLLAMASSLANQGAKGAERTEDFIEMFTGRLQALSTATRMVLSSGNQTTEQLDRIIRSQLEPALMAYGDRIQIEGPAIEVSSDAAQQICLAVHELATNLVKYNFPVSTDTEVRVRWELLDDHQFEFCWDEGLSAEAVKRFESSERKGFGSKLLDKLVPTFLRGKAKRKITGSRLIYRLEIPSASLLAQ